MLRGCRDSANHLCLDRREPGFDSFEPGKSLLQITRGLLVAFVHRLQCIFDTAGGLEQGKVLLPKRFDVGGLFVENTLDLTDTIENGSDLGFQLVFKSEKLFRELPRHIRESLIDLCELPIHLVRHIRESLIDLCELPIHLVRRIRESLIDLCELPIHLVRRIREFLIDLCELPIHLVRRIRESLVDLRELPIHPVRHIRKALVDPCELPVHLARYFPELTVPLNEL
jgi:hypothetical protein